MKKTFLAFLIVCFAGLSAVGQESGNQGVYGRRTQRTNPSNGAIYGTEEKDLVPIQFVEAYVLFNAEPDEFVAVFGVAQEAPTASESNQKVNAQVEQFLAAAAKLGVNRGNTYVDMITQNRIYNFGPAGNDNTIREKLSGFETKKTISVKYKDRALLEKLLAAAAQASIFDLIKVDYVVADLNKIRSRLLEEASTVIKQKEDGYTRLLNLRFKRTAIAQESYETYYPGELYLSYTAAESGSVDTSYQQSGARVVRERKSSTSFLEPLDRSAFDVVINSAGLEPVVQCTLYLKVRYSLTP
jgi:uncharacterized protein YggE